MLNFKSLFQKNSVRKIFSSTAVYAGGNLLTKAISFILIPILTRVLTPHDYGTLATFVAVFAIVQMVIYMGTTDAIIRVYFDREKTDFDFPKYVFNGFFVSLMMFFIVLSIFYVGKQFFSKVIPIPFGYQILIPVLGLFVAIYGIPSKLWVIMKKPIPYTIFNLSSILIEVVLSLLLVVVVGLNWQGRVWALTLSKLIFFVVSIYILFRHNFFRISLDKTYFKSVINYGFPVVLHSLGFVIIAAIDRFFLNKFIGISVTGVYSVSYAICSMIAFFAGAFNLAWVPYFYEKLGSITRDHKLRLVQFTYIYFALILLGVAAFIGLVPFALKILVGGKFSGVKAFIPWLAVGFGFHSMYAIVVSYIFYMKKTYILSKIAIFTVILSFVANYILININGAIGVAQATCIVFFCRFLLVWYFSNKTYSMPWFTFSRPWKVKTAKSFL